MTNKVASCDADGIIKLWDARMVAEMGAMDAGPHPLNYVCLDRSATRLAAASNDGQVKVRTGERRAFFTKRGGHQSIRFPADRFKCTSQF